MTTVSALRTANNFGNTTWASNSIVQPALTAEGDVLLTSQENGTRRIAVAHNASGWNVAERWTSNGPQALLQRLRGPQRLRVRLRRTHSRVHRSQDGERKWKGGRYGNGQLVLLPDQDLLLVLSEEGELALVGATPDQFTERAKMTAIQGKTWNHPVLVGDILLVRNAEEMAAFRLAR